MSLLTHNETACPKCGSKMKRADFHNFRNHSNEGNSKNNKIKVNLNSYRK
jgi:hypothetical protein